EEVEVVPPDGAAAAECSARVLALRDDLALVRLDPHVAVVEDATPAGLGIRRQQRVRVARGDRARVVRERTTLELQRECEAAEPQVGGDPFGRVEARLAAVRLDGAVK